MSFQKLKELRAGGTLDSGEVFDLLFQAGFDRCWLLSAPRNTPHNEKLGFLAFNFYCRLHLPLKYYCEIYNRNLNNFGQ